MANIKLHFDQSRSDAQAVVCMKKIQVAIQARFGKSGSDLHKLRRFVMRTNLNFSILVVLNGCRSIKQCNHIWVIEAHKIERVKLFHSFLTTEFGFGIIH